MNTKDYMFFTTGIHVGMIELYVCGYIQLEFFKAFAKNYFQNSSRDLKY